MPIIIKNGKTYGDRSVTLSQAEYNALSEVEKNNGTCYYIYDVNGVVTADDVALDGGTVETLAGSVETFESSPATATHEVGDHILWNGQLYTVTAAIAVGETLTVGTNITSTNVGSELTALKAGLTRITVMTYTVAVGNSTSVLGNNVGYGDKNLTSDMALYGTPVSFTALDNASVPCLVAMMGNGYTCRIISISPHSSSRTAVLKVTFASSN